MSPTFPLSPSGLPSVETNWGGLTKGGTYLLVGHAQAGRPRHIMTTVRAAIQTGEHCLLISARPQEALIEQAAQIGMDLPSVSQSQQVRLLKSPPGRELAALGDEGLTKSLKDLIELARKHNAGRVVMDDFSSFVQYRVFDAFADAFRQFIQDAAGIKSTVILGLGEPANEASKSLLRFLEGEVAGTVHTTTDAYDEAHFELLPGTAHVSLPETPSVSPFTEVTIESSAAPPKEVSTPKREVESQNTLSLPPFELSFPTPNNGGDGSNEPIETPDFAAAVEESVPIIPIAPPQSSGDTAWAEIRPVSHSDAPFSPDELDTFLTGRTKLDISDGYYVDSAGPTNLSTGAPTPKPTLQQTASDIQHAAYPELFAPIAADDPTLDFREALADAYSRRASESFLVMALRLPENDPFVDIFPAIAEGVRIGIGQSGTMHTGRNGLIALIPSASTDVARNVFAILKAHLKTIVPGRAETALQHVNAMAVPNGEPFKTADELFAYAFEN